MVNIRLVSDVEAFAGLRRAWGDLLEHCTPNHVFMTWEWFFTWWKHFGASRGLFILAVYNGKELIGLFPLMLAPYPQGYGYKRYQVRYLHFIGFRYEQRWNDSMDIPAVRKPEVIESVLNYLRKRHYLWDFIDLWDVAEDSETLKVLVDCAGRVGLPVVSTSRIDPGPYVPTTSDWRAYYRGQVSKNTRENIERKIRRLQEKGTLAFVQAEPGTLMSHLTSLFELYERAEAKGMKAVMFSQPVYRDFYGSLVRACPFEWFYCPTLQVDGEPIAAFFGFRYNFKIYFETTVFDPEYAAHSPGAVLLRYIMEDCFADKEIREFDFGRGGEPYKYKWTTAERQACRVLIGNADGAGVAEKVLRRMPIAVHRSLIGLLSAREGS